METGRWLIPVAALALSGCVFSEPDPGWVKCMEGQDGACSPAVCESLSSLPADEVPPSCRADVVGDAGSADAEPDAPPDPGTPDVPPDPGPPDTPPDPGPDEPTCGEGDPTVGPDMPELCDGKDNDCDGSTDEELIAPAASKTDGVCLGQAQVCAGSGGWQDPDYTQISGYQADETDCDSADNDCDGVADESCPCDYLGKSGGVCGGSTVSSSDGACLEPAGYESDETTCDTLDNDCDGSTDEGCCGSLGVVCPTGFSCTAKGTCENLATGEVYVPAGRFWMGCNAVLDAGCTMEEVPQHPVEVPPFVIDRTEVTVTEYKACVLDGGACVVPGSTGHPAENHDAPDRQNHPANSLTWHDAADYCDWRASATGQGWRLCAESEWEKAARGGCELTGCAEGDDVCCKAAMPTYPWGEEPPSCDSPALAVFEDGFNNEGCGTATTWPAGSMPDGVSPYGALNMVGNVSEWLEDWYHISYEGAPADGTAWVEPTGSARVGGGGSFAFPPSWLRVANRTPSDPSDISPYFGVRCCRSLP